MEKKKVGAPKKYANSIMISHQIELAQLDKLNELATFKVTRTELINTAINQYLERIK